MVTVYQKFMALILFIIWLNWLAMKRRALIGPFICFNFALLKMDRRQINLVIEKHTLLTIQTLI